MKVAEKGWDFFPREEAAKLVGAARDDEERVSLLFARDTGARVGEQLALEWGDIDSHNKVVMFRRSSTRGQVGWRSRDASGRCRSRTGSRRRSGASST